MRCGRRKTSSDHAACLPKRTLAVAAPCEGQVRQQLRCAGLVARAACPEPDPISNSAVKHASAHGTVSQGTGESVAARPAQRNPSIPSPRSAQRPRSPPNRRSASPDQPHNLGAGWSSPVARQAHNLKVTGSNPVPVTNEGPEVQRLRGLLRFRGEGSELQPKCSKMRLIASSIAPVLHRCCTGVAPVDWRKGGASIAPRGQRAGSSWSRVIMSSLEPAPLFRPR